MIASRRNFIRLAGLGTATLGLLPSFQSFGFSPEFLSRKTPESQGVSSTGIRAFLKAIEASGLEWHSFMLVRHGHVVAEGWWKPFEAKYPHTLYSLSKSFTSTAIGFLVNEKKISVEDKVIDFFKDELPSSVPDNLRAMKIKHLLTMNTGHGVDTLPKLRDTTGQSWVKTFLQQPVEYTPGTHFLYNTGATYMLGAILYQVTGQTLEDYLQPRLFQPLEIVSYDWEKSPDGLNTAGYGLRVKTEDIARFGQLYLQNGQWEGKQLLPESWIKEATSKQTTSNAGDSDWSQGYGYQFWRCKPGFYRGDGAYGQFCMVMPDQDAVLVMTSESWDLQKTMNVAYETLLPAMSTGRLKEIPAELAALKKEISELVLPIPRGNFSGPNPVQYSGEVFRLDKNTYGITHLSVELTNDSCLLKMTTAEGVKNIKFGWKKWITSNKPIDYLFPVKTRIEVPSYVAGTATWIDKDTLQLNVKFVSAIHGDQITVVFKDKGINVAFLNSISANTKSLPEKRERLTGVITT
jgi:CubicO group peptidase (beta-lactamase class C family)